MNDDVDDDPEILFTPPFAVDIPLKRSMLKQAVAIEQTAIECDEELACHVEATIDLHAEGGPVLTLEFYEPLVGNLLQLAIGQPVRLPIYYPISGGDGPPPAEA